MNKKQLTITFEETEDTQKTIDVFIESVNAIAHIMYKKGIEIRVKEEEVEVKKI